MRKKSFGQWLSFVAAVVVTVGVSLLLYLAAHSRLIFLPAALVIALLGFAFFFEKAFAVFAGYLLKFRWLAALLVFVFCVSFHLHGSSIGVFDRYFPTASAQAADSYRIWGEDRQIRSDEWAVQTPTYFSQAYNDYGMLSDQMSISETNMVLDYFAPVKDVTVIGKPFSWGYLLFGNEVGLSWYWCGMMIALFMASFEMFLILTRRNVRLSVVGMCLIGLSPVMQWWFVPHIPIVFLYAMALFDIGYYFFTARSVWLRWLTALLAAMAAIGFALSIFPSCQVIMALVMVTLLIVTLLRDKEQITLTKDFWYRIGAALLITAGVLGYFLLTYREDLHMILNTVYPGKRVSVGGDKGLYDLFTELRSLFLPYKDSNLSNNSEIASYFHFAPLFLLLFPRISACLRKKGDRNRLVGQALFVILLVQIVFMCAGFSETLAKLTLFKFVNRMSLSYGWTATVFTVWALWAVWEYPDILKRWEKIVYPLLYGLIYCTFIDQSLRAYLPLWLILAEIAGFVVILLCSFQRWKKIASCLMIGVICAAGLMVNPLCRGIAPITDHPLSDFIAEQVKEDPDARWITADTNFIVGNFLMANGAKVIGATNFYPDVRRWEILDPTGEYDEVYNRYTNQYLFLTREHSHAVLRQVDDICIYVNPEDLKKMEIKYLITPVDPHEILREYQITDTPVAEQDGYRVYQLSY